MKPFEQAPKLERSDFVQNSNDSYWLTNPAQPITDVSILYGETDNQQTLRSRMGQRMLVDSAGSDQRFTAREVESALFSFRNYLGESVLDALVTQCKNQGDVPVETETASINIAAGCAVLSHWDGGYDKSSVGAVLFREFATQFNRNPQWQIPFDPADPLNTPNGLLASDITLQQFAQAILNMQTAGVALDAPLGDVQFVQVTDEYGLPGAERLPWSGSHNVEGGFNVFRPNYGDDYSLLPRLPYMPIAGSQLSADAAGYPVGYGSSWMMLVQFTAKGPKARGLMTYSQSTDPTSEHQLDQSRVYSDRPQLVDMPFTDQEIQQQLVSELNLHFVKPVTAQSSTAQ